MSIMSVTWDEDQSLFALGEAKAREKLDAEWQRRGLSSEYVERTYRDKHGWRTTETGAPVVIRAIYREVSR